MMMMMMIVMVVVMGNGLISLQPLLVKISCGFEVNHG
jgi:hypothetical protein